MKAFFDTNVYINTFFKQQLPRDQFINFFKIYDIFVCPVVKHELLLGTINSKTRHELELFFDQCPVLEAPSATLWNATTDLMKKLGWKENKQQNDVLIALVANQEPATLITYDKHFKQIAKHLEFDLVLLEEK